MGEYKDFAQCLKANQDKDDPDAYCGSIYWSTEGKDSKKHEECGMCEEFRKMEEECMCEECEEKDAIRGQHAKHCSEEHDNVHKSEDVQFSTNSPNRRPPEERECGICDGTGNGGQCKSCDGTGITTEPREPPDMDEEMSNLPPGTSVNDIPGYDDRFDRECEDCEGTGDDGNGGKCYTCHGTGRLTEPPEPDPDRFHDDRLEEILRVEDDVPVPKDEDRIKDTLSKQCAEAQTPEEHAACESSACGCFCHGEEASDSMSSEPEVEVATDDSQTSVEPDIPSIEPVPDPEILTQAPTTDPQLPDSTLPVGRDISSDIARAQKLLDQAEVERSQSKDLRPTTLNKIDKAVRDLELLGKNSGISDTQMDVIASLYEKANHLYNPPDTDMQSWEEKSEDRISSSGDQGGEGVHIFDKSPSQADIDKAVEPLEVATPDANLLPVSLEKAEGIEGSGFAPSISQFAGTPFDIEDKADGWRIFMLEKAEEATTIEDAYKLQVEDGVMAEVGAYYDETGDKFEDIIALDFEKEIFPTEEDVDDWIEKSTPENKTEEVLLDAQFRNNENVAIIAACPHVKHIEDLGNIVLLCCSKSKKPVGIRIANLEKELSSLYVFDCAREIDAYLRGGLVSSPYLRKFTEYLLGGET